MNPHSLPFLRSALRLAITGMIAAPTTVFSAIGDPLGSEIQINALLGPAAAAYRADGGFVIASLRPPEEGSPNVEVLASRFSADGLPLGEDQLLTTLVLNGSDEVDVAIGPGGAVVVAWEGDCNPPIPGSDCLFGRRFSAMGAPRDMQPILLQTLPTTTVDGFDAIDVDMDAQGDLVVAAEYRLDDAYCYEDYCNDAFLVSARRYSGSTGVIKEVDLDLGSSRKELRKADSVAVDMDSDGDFVVSAVTGNLPNGIRTLRYSATGLHLWSDFLESPPGGYPQPSGLSVALDESGQVAVVFNGRKPDDVQRTAILSRRLRSDGAPRDANPVQISTAGPDTGPSDADFFGLRYRSPELASDGRGGFIYSWIDTCEACEDGRLLVRRMGADGNPIDAAEVRVTERGYSQSDPVVAANGNGNHLVAWRQNGFPAELIGGTLVQRFEGYDLPYNPPDITPAPFTFSSRSADRPRTRVISESVKIRGLGRTGAPIFVGGDPSTEYRINDRPFTSATGVIRNGDSLRLRVRAPNKSSSVNTGVVTVGAYSTSFNVRTDVTR